MSVRNLDKAFAPKSIVLIDASERAGSDVKAHAIIMYLSLLTGAGAGRGAEMIHMCRELGFTLHARGGDLSFPQAELDLRSPASTPARTAAS